MRKFGAKIRSSISHICIEQLLEVSQASRIIEWCKAEKIKNKLTEIIILHDFH